MSARKALYKVIFLNHGKTYELYARRVSASDLYGFVEVADLQFDAAGLVLDPVEERLREEFANTQALHLPIHSVVRVEEVHAKGTSRIREAGSGEKVIPFSVAPPPR
ncbi:MAG: DUF1820 family protein [Xanthomonadales bacterium]|nr:DUF1820 family protein [Xanthomonadales bacterium]MCB1628624.1 DUF1820 family protein [Xanthomonadales bacterium]